MDPESLHDDLFPFRVQRLRRQAIATLAVIAGLVGSSWTPRRFQWQPTAPGVAIPSKRRSPRAVLDLRIATPDGSLWMPRLKSPLGETVMGTLKILERDLTVRLTQNKGGCALMAFATAPAFRKYAPFQAVAEEGLPAVWRLPSPQGLATIRVHLHRTYMGE